MGTSTRGLLALALALISGGCGFPRPPDVIEEGSPEANLALLAVEPATAATGQTILLEGTFGADTQVRFPGDVVVPATVLGSHRARVVVPDGATAGDLTVVRGERNITAGPLPFRRTSFALGLQPFESPHAQSGGVRQRSLMVTPRSGHTAVALGDWLYVVGGTSNGRYLETVERALINADGSIGAFHVVQATSLAVARAGHATARVGAFLYVFGGANATGILNSVERAKIADDGALGAFEPVPAAALTSARDHASATVLGNTVYVIGGTGVLGTVEQAPIGPDGALGAFAVTAGVALTAARAGHTATPIGAYLYVVGGTANGTPLRTIERAELSGDGVLGAFATLPGIALSTARAEHTSQLVGSYLYAVGGNGPSGPLATVERAAIGPDGSLASFAAVPGVAMPGARAGHASAIVGNYLYQVGGAATPQAGSELGSVAVSSINGSGAFAPFAAVPELAPVRTRSLPHVVAIGRYVYLLGGDDPRGTGGTLQTVERAPVARDGTIGRFALVDQVTVTPEGSGLTMFVAGDAVYLVGGLAELTAKRAPILADGSLGTFVTVPAVALPAARHAAQALVLDDSVYVIGGYNGNQFYSSTLDRATIGPDGAVGTPATVQSISMPRAIAEPIAFTLRAEALIAGGIFKDSISGATGGFDEVARAELSPGGEIIDLTAIGPRLAVPRARAGHVTVGPSAYLFGGVSGGPAGEFVLRSIERTVPGADGRVSAFELVSGQMLPTVAGRNTAVIFGDQLYVFGLAPWAVDRAQLR